MKTRLQCVRVYIYVAVSLAAAVLQSVPVGAVDIPTKATPLKKAPYSQVFFTGSTYAVKDRDSDPDNRLIGFSTVWSSNPAKKSLRVAVRYCLKDDSIALDSSYLTGMVLLNKGQPLLKINQSIKTTAARQRVLRSSYYSSGAGVPLQGNGFRLYDDEETYWGDFDPFWGPPSDDFNYTPPDYNPPVTCSAGGSVFDLARLAGAIAQLPLQELQVQLVFSHEKNQNLHLGKKTVQALHKLLAIRSIMASPKSPVTNP